MDLMTTTALITGVVAVAGIAVPLAFRTVVPTNEVHIVQSTNRTLSFGKDLPGGNVYYQWPAWLPRLGLSRIILPVSVFSERLDNYNAYDKDRLPFVLDIIGFFHVEEPNIAAQRVATFAELQQQLTGILQGAIRSILAQSTIQEIMEGRSAFGQKFTQEVDEQLKAWGVKTVKNLELMDIRDAQQSSVIANIMAMKKSHIEMSSRVEVAKNNQSAQEAEIAANQAVATRKQEADQMVGVRTATAAQAVNIATQQAQQAVREQERITAEKTMEVNKVNAVRAAEINKEAAEVLADQQRAVMIVQADGQKEAALLAADATIATGNAKAAAETAILTAPVNAQITLAKEIGGNKEYQEYLLKVRGIEADQAVGTAQAKALEEADVRVVSSAGSPNLGMAFGALVEGLAATPAGRRIVASLKAK